MSGYRGRGRRYRGTELWRNLLQVGRLTPFPDDYREPVQETPEQRLRSTIVKLGEVVSSIKGTRKSLLVSHENRPPRTLSRSFTGWPSSYTTTQLAFPSWLNVSGRGTSPSRSHRRVVYRKSRSLTSTAPPRFRHRVAEQPHKIPYYAALLKILHEPPPPEIASGFPEGVSLGRSLLEDIWKGFQGYLDQLAWREIRLCVSPFRSIFTSSPINQVL